MDARVQVDSVLLYTSPHQTEETAAPASPVPTTRETANASGAATPSTRRHRNGRNEGMGIPPSCRPIDRPSPSTPGGRNWRIDAPPGQEGGPSLGGPAFVVPSDPAEGRRSPRLRLEVAGHHVLSVGSGPRVGPHECEPAGRADVPTLVVPVVVGVT